MHKLNRNLSSQVDNSPLILFRMIFGLLITLEAWGAIMTGWVTKTFVEPAYHFPFMDFSWLQPLPGDGMYYYFVVMGLAGVMVMIGWYYRLGISIFTVMWAAVYFMQKTSYNNHYYLLLLLCIFMCLVPAHANHSLDAKLKTGIKSNSCPRWCLWIFIAQMAIVYFYASVAKMYPDWIEGKPIAIWFAAKKDYWLVGSLLQEKWFQFTIAYGGILFDLLIVPALLWKKSRNVAFWLSLFFHLFNSVIFQVGIFPFMAIGLNVFFFKPETIRSIFFKKRPPIEVGKETPIVNPVLLYSFLIYFAIQVILPIRHHFYPSNVYWTEEGHRLAWRMMLRVKSGYLTFKVVDTKTGKEWNINPTEYLTTKQTGQVATRPDMFWQFVQILKDDYAKKGHPDIEIYANSGVSLNGRPYLPLYKPKVNLADVEWNRFKHSEWLTDYVVSKR